MVHQLTYYVRAHRKIPFWKKWLMKHSSWYKYNIGWKQPIWVVYDILNKKEILPGGVTKNEASNYANIMEDARKEIIHN